jgi:hypothetical protein
VRAQICEFRSALRKLRGRVACAFCLSGRLVW